MAAEHFLKALRRGQGPNPAVGSGTSIVCTELMDRAGAGFPEAHRDASAMATLAMAGHTVLEFDVVMPLFSVWHESAALGCEVRWGDRHHMPDSNTAIWGDVDDMPDFKHDARFLDAPTVRVPLEAIGLLKKRLGSDAAVCGKVFGPWTLGYHTFGVENWLMDALAEPQKIHKAIEKLKHVTPGLCRRADRSGGRLPAAGRSCHVGSVLAENVPRISPADPYRTGAGN